MIVTDPAKNPKRKRKPKKPAKIKKTDLIERLTLAANKLTAFIVAFGGAVFAVLRFLNKISGLLALAGVACVVLLINSGDLKASKHNYHSLDAMRVPREVATEAPPYTPGSVGSGCAPIGNSERYYILLPDMDMVITDDERQTLEVVLIRMKED